MGGIRNFLFRLALIGIVLALWEAAVIYFDVPRYILPLPSQVSYGLYNGFASGLYIDHLEVTLAETFIGFALGCALAFVFGTMVALSRPLEYFLYPFIVMFQAMPKVALAPLIVVWFGLGMTSKVVNAALVAFFPLMVNTIVGLKSAEEDRISLMRSLAASKWQIFWMLQLPNAMPYIFAGLEIAMIFALIGAIVGEFLGAQHGLGLMIRTAQGTFNANGVLAAMVIIAIVALAAEGLLTVLERRLLRWRPSQLSGPDL